MTSITITTQHNSATITVPDDGLTCDALVEELVQPALLAIGYHPETVTRALSDA